MYKDFKKCLKGKLHIIIMCIISRKIRELWTKKIAKFESDAYSYRVEKIYSDLYDGGHKLCSPPYKPL